VRSTFLRFHSGHHFSQMMPKRFPQTRTFNSCITSI
jgi:hypothetical protein